MQMCVFYLFHLCYFVITSTRSTSTEAARSGENEKKKRMKKITVVCSRSPRNLEFGHCTLLFCRVRQKNGPKFKTHVQSGCFYSLNLLSLPLPLSLLKASDTPGDFIRRSRRSLHRAHLAIFADRRIKSPGVSLA